MVKSIEFEIRSAQNPRLFVLGGVRICDDNLEYYFITEMGHTIKKMVVHYCTKKDLEDVGKFKKLINDVYCDELEELITNADEDEHFTHNLNNKLILRVNGGDEFYETG